MSCACLHDVTGTQEADWFTEECCHIGRVYRRESLSLIGTLVGRCVLRLAAVVRLPACYLCTWIVCLFSACFRSFISLLSCLFFVYLSFFCFFDSLSTYSLCYLFLFLSSFVTSFISFPSLFLHLFNPLSSIRLLLFFHVLFTTLFISFS